jgi:PAS domain S-box-containing protein
LTHSLRHGGRRYGILSVSVPAGYALNGEEQSLFNELAGDLAFALHKIEAFKHQRANQTMLSRTERIASIGSWEWDIADDRVRWSEELFRIFQRDPAEGAPSFAEHSDLYADEDMQRLRQAVERCATNGTPYALELRGRRKDGAIRHCVARGQAETDSEGKIRGIVGSLQDITESKQLGERLALLGRMLDGAPASITIHDADGRFLFTNQQTLRLHGYETEEEFQAVNLHDLDVPESEAMLAERFRRIAETGEARFESAHYRKDGSILPLDITAKVITWNGRPAILSIAADITERKLTEEALQASEERHRLLSDMTMEGILLHKNGVAIDMNAAVSKILQIDRDELLKRNFLEFVHAEDRPLALENIPKEYAPPYTVRVVRRTGETLFVEIESRNFQKQGETLRVSAVRDITERKRVEEKLLKSEERFRLAFATSPDAININRMSDGLYEDVNEGFLQLTGFTREDVIGRTSREIKIWQNMGDREELIRQLQEKGYCENLEANFVRKDGSATTALMSAKVIFFQDVPHILSITRDISDRKKAEAVRIKLEEQLRQAQKMESVGRLAGGIAHDFNNMLGVILGRTEMAMEKVAPSQPLHAELVQIRMAAERSADLTRQLLAFARKQTISPKVLDLNKSVEEMFKMLHRLIGEDIHLAWIPGVNLWPVKVDPSQIDQIMANLSVNARDAIAGVGKITIETGNVVFDEAYCADHAGFVPGEHVMLVFSDDGSGMDKETMSRIFEPFFTTKGAGKGTGLGLATVYGIVKQNNGFINVYSEPGQGTTFRIYLPRYEGKAEQSRTGGLQEPVMHGHEVVLVVEDEPSLLALAKAMLEDQGYRVLTAGAPGEAILLAEKQSGEIHLLMTDVVMPGMNGRDLAKKMLSLYPRLKCLFMSGYTANVIAHHGVLDEGVHFIQKPFSRKDLAAKVREALDRK